MAAESCMCLFEAMDHLWFGQIIISLFPTSKSPNYSSKNISQISLIVSDQQISTIQVETKSQESDHVQETTSIKNLVSRKTRPSSSSSPTSAKKQSRSVSCKSLGDLELEEVKGFMDLGFVFEKEDLSSHVISLIPGLQRMSCDGDENEEGKGKMRPYLSEAWLDSPLVLSLRISRVCNNSDMVKKHLKNWARTVALAIHQQS